MMINNDNNSTWHSWPNNYSLILTTFALFPYSIMITSNVRKSYNSVCMYLVSNVGSFSRSSTFSLGIRTPARLGFSFLSSAVFFFFSFLGLGSAGFRFWPRLLVGVAGTFLCPLFPFWTGEGVDADLDPLRVRFAGGSSSSSSSSPPSSLSDA